MTRGPVQVQFWLFNSKYNQLHLMQHCFNLSCEECSLESTKLCISTSIYTLSLHPSISLSFQLRYSKITMGPFQLRIFYHSVKLETVKWLLQETCPKAWMGTNTVTGHSLSQILYSASFFYCYGCWKSNIAK